jgi:beta-lactamase superfamily II metal-dependent hydrolase
MFLVPVMVLGLLSSAEPQSSRTFDIYVIDVEGGEATLFVSPSGQSLLVDTGWPGFDGRDADRIVAAATAAGIKQIDYLVVTHYHSDHVGGTAQLGARLPIRHFIDHGSNVGDDERELFLSYSQIRGAPAWSEAKPGDRIPMAGLDVRVIASGGTVLGAPISGPGLPNSSCANFEPHGPEITGRTHDPGDLRSVSLWLTYGKFRTVIMGDLTWNKEYELMCPVNPLGEVDAYLVSHHGSDTSGSAALVHALRPRAAIMNNGPRKGGAVQTFRILDASPGLEDLWQIHYSVPAGSQLNRSEVFIANLDDGSSVTNASSATPPVHMGPAHWIKLSASADGGFVITNTRNGFTKRYQPRTSN